MHSLKLFSNSCYSFQELLQSKSTACKIIGWKTVACVASVSVGFGCKERDFWCFARAENGEREPKLKYGGWGGGGEF